MKSATAVLAALAAAVGLAPTKSSAQTTSDAVFSIGVWQLTDVKGDARPAYRPGRRPKDPDDRETYSEIAQRYGKNFLSFRLGGWEIKSGGACDGVSVFRGESFILFGDVFCSLENNGNSYISLKAEATYDATDKCRVELRLRPGTHNQSNRALFGTYDFKCILPSTVDFDIQGSGLISYQRFR